MPGRRDVLPVLAILLLLVVLGLWLLGPEAIAPDEDAYDRTLVHHGDDHTVEVRIADTVRKRYVGLSATDSLEPGEGMLFVHRSEGEHRYVMREMDFGIDIVFIAANGTVTSVHRAPAPDPGRGEGQRYVGTGKYVLEVPIGYTNETGLDRGDTVDIEGY